MTLQKHCITYESPENNTSFTSMPVFTSNWKVVILISTCKRGTGLKKEEKNPKSKPKPQNKHLSSPP